MSEHNSTFVQSDITELEARTRRNRRWVILAVILSIVAIILALVLRGCDAASPPNSSSTCAITSASPGAAGATGAIGAAGISAYELWIQLGNTGDEQDFLDSLIGEGGASGYIGETGLSGPGGGNGAAGASGKSAYELWLAAGNTGTTQDFLTSLLGTNGTAGATGLSAYQLWLSLGHVGTETDFINSLIGIQGIAGIDGICVNGTDGTNGTNGADGVNGLSAYQVWVLNGHTGQTQAAFLASLVGAAGTNGTNGAQGATGPAGPAGPQGIQGPAGLSGLGSSASYFSTVDQGPSAANTIQALTLNQTDWQTGIALESGSHLKVLNAGQYNIAFSIQLHQLNSSGVVNIWLAKNGVAMPDTNTKMSITANNPYFVAAWNFFVNANSNDYYEIMWSSTDNQTVIESEPAGVHPAIPSVIITVNQVG